MPALNIKFTDEELARLRKQAEVEDRSMVSLAHDAVVDRSREHEQDRMVIEASTRVIALSEELLERLADWPRQRAR